MELWIRSQDKERLIKVENLYIEFNGDTNPKIDSHRIVTDKFINLGIYKSKERALEVLDKIETKMAYINDEYVSGHNSLIIFEMPKE